MAKYFACVKQESILANFKIFVLDLYYTNICYFIGNSNKTFFYPRFKVDSVRLSYTNNLLEKL